MSNINQGPFTTRPEIDGTFGVVASTHWIGTAVGMGILERGGNAFDAGVAAAFTLQVVEPHLCGPGGDVPAMLYDTRKGEPVVVCGQGPAPAGATIAHYRDRLGLDIVPGTGLLPAFATFDAKGKEGDTDLSVHFGFAPQVQCGGRNHDCFGAQIDMRQVFLTAGGSWGQVLAGKELALFNRQNILNDQTLFGVGATGIAPAASCPPVIATAELYRILYVTFVPAAIAWRIAREPEWKNVPSPRF